MNHQQTLVERQFGAAATDYLHSPAHAQGADFQRLRQEFAGQGALRILDLGCGAGHASFALADVVGEVLAVDLSAEMLRVVAEQSRQRGLNNIHTAQQAAESLPFADGSFDGIVTRFSAHHWANLPAALREMRRVLHPGGKCVIIDVFAPENPLGDTFLQTVELLRDPSHVRDYRVSEWQRMLTAAGWRVVDQDTWKLPLDFASWIARMRCPEERVAAIQSVWSKAPAEVIDHFAVQPNRDFALDVCWMTALPV
ncbi:methyltransferase domain-containing protein [Acidithiobacillus montserratensis]|uniref:Methyltransferase domain-containing protein n=1 Tax=Acidithiobacillus montserratensis TaxID=2729135 RepID=A0ACD5HGB5_9PROT|nr:class I SAM-dependent methyltransferase [Acidithiobacillus montserratensis]MBN2678757.1 methyltransferase domain-containing protein [Acidithiobacillaceae bacterium]MBU2747451.1 methyltransferase domain-containing protein [Acidithiobacillus montserratensis]